MGDYDRKPMEPPSQWLRLKSKGDEVRLRIAGKPMRELKVWPTETGGKPLDPSVTHDFTAGQWMALMSDPDWSVSEVFHFLVIDRADSCAKVFTTTGGVYGKIRDYATNEEWGNPMGYDLTIKRTESPGKNYYEVTPSPNKTDLMRSELDKVKALDLSKMLPNARALSLPQPDDFGADVHPEPLPWARAAATPPAPAAEPPAQTAMPEDTAAAFQDEPINLDDIPFN